MKPVPYVNLQLGSRVMIVEAKIEGLVIEHTVCIDGTENWSVEFWHEGERCSIKCEPRELRLATENEDGVLAP